jgi:hypothetical protein
VDQGEDQGIGREDAHALESTIDADDVQWGQGEQNTVFHGYLELGTELLWYARLERYMEDMLERLDKMMNRKREEG